MKPLCESEVWSPTGSQDPYGQNPLRSVADQAVHVAAGMDAPASKGR